MTVSDLDDRMTHEEFSKWVTYFEERPIGWREDYRAYLIMRTQGVKQKPAEIFASLAPIFTRKVNIEADGTSMMDLAHSGLAGFLMNAKGGDKIEFTDKDESSEDIED